MSILSAVVISESLTTIVIGGVVSAVLYYAGHHFMLMQKHTSELVEFMRIYTEKHNSIERDIKRIEKDLTLIESEIKQDLKALTTKVDKLITEIKFDRA